MRDILDGVSGDRLLGDDYWEDFGENFWKTDEGGFWKLERRQNFQEPGSDSWKAFVQGNWKEALRLTEARRPSMQEYYQKIEDHGFHTHRVRVVEKPISPYLHWELHLLRLRDELGGTVRVVTAEQVCDREQQGQLPEIVTLGTNVMYQLLYDDDGLQLGGIRYADRDLIRRWQRIIQDLYAVGENIVSFFEREVVPLTAPSGG
jgi:hypothetical protein